LLIELNGLSNYSGPENPKINLCEFPVVSLEFGRVIFGVHRMACRSVLAGQLGSVCWNTGGYSFRWKCQLYLIMGRKPVFVIFREYENIVSDFSQVLGLVSESLQGCNLMQRIFSLVNFLVVWLLVGGYR
jgi:hypothetical protein